MRNFLVLTLSTILFYSCDKIIKHPSKSNFTYFEKGELSKDEDIDSIRNHFFSEALWAMEEPSLQNSNSYSLRVMSLSSFYNPYIIRVEKTDSVVTVVFKFKGDKPNFVRAGLNSLNLTYASNHERMDSLVNDLFKNVNEYDFSPAFDEVEFDAMDGFNYLLECSCNGKYQVVKGWSGEDYKGKKELFEIIHKMHVFVPDGFIPDLRKARELKDVLFPVFRRDSIPRIN